MGKTRKISRSSEYVEYTFAFDGLSILEKLQWTPQLCPRGVYSLHTYKALRTPHIAMSKLFADCFVGIDGSANVYTGKGMVICEF